MVFDKGKKIETTPKKAKKEETPRVSIKGAFSYACICTAISTLNSLKETYETQLKGSALSHWIKEGMSLSRRPANFKAIEGTAMVQMDLKIRPSTSAVSPADVDFCDQHDIPLGRHVKRIGAWVLSPEIASDQKKMKKVAEALKGLPFADELFLWQEEETVDIVTEDTMEAIFKLDDKDTVTTLLRTLSVVAAKPTQDNADEAFKHVAGLIVQTAAVATEATAVERNVKVKSKAA